MKEMAYHRLRSYACAAPERIIQELNTSQNGLRREQAGEQRQKYGSNTSAANTQNTLPRCVCRAFINPFSLILLVLAIISFVAELLLPGDGRQGGATAIIITAMLFVSGSVRLAQELRAKQVADRLTSLVHTTVSVCRDGAWREVPSEELVVGDLVRLGAGDRVPADIRLLHAEELFVSQSVVTGESGIQEKTAAVLETQPETIRDYTNILFCGSTVAGGTGRGMILAVGTDTVYGALSRSKGSRKQGFDNGASSIARVLARFTAVLVPAVFLTCGLTRGNWLEAFLFALSIAVGLTPELLPMVVNACLAWGSVQMGKKRVIVKNINAMQGFGSMDVLCVDKTGTLTEDTVQLEYYMDILGNESSRVLEYAFLNSYYHTGVMNYLDSAILQCRTMPGREEAFQNLTAAHPKLDEQPFDYERKYVSVLLGDNTKNLCIVKGSAEEVAAICRYVDYRGQITEICGNVMENVHAVLDEMTEDGMKVLAVAYKLTGRDTLVPEEQDFILLGYLAFFDAPKQSAASAMEALNALRVDVRVLTGDDTQATLSVCRRLGIGTDHVLTGRELGELSGNELPIRIEQTRIFTQLSPKQKAEIVEILQANGHSVGFLGDGMNDLPAAFRADVGISVDTACEAVKEGADVILLKKDLNVLEQGILEGRKAFANMSKYIKITASSNFGNILAVAAAAVLLPFLPMSSIQILLLNLLYDILCLVLPWDSVDGELLTAPPKWTGNTLGRFMARFGPVSTLFDLVTFAFLFFALCPSICGGAFGTLNLEGRTRFIALFHTGWFLESMWTQVLILHLLRTPKAPLIQSRPSAPVAWTTVIGIALFTLLTVMPFGRLLGLTALPVGYYVFLAADVLLYLLLITVTKSFYQKKYHELL